MQGQPEFDDNSNNRSYGDSTHKICPRLANQSHGHSHVLFNSTMWPPRKTGRLVSADGGVWGRGLKYSVSFL